MTIHKNNEVNNETEEVEITIIPLEKVQQEQSNNCLVSNGETESHTYLQGEATKTIDLLHDWNDALNYQYFLITLRKFYDYFEEDSEQKEAWMKSINITIDKALSTFEHIEKYIKGAEILMQHDQLLKNIFAEDLANLKPLENIPEMMNEKESIDNFDALLDVIKKEINKGTKVSYKMLVELQDQLDLLQDKLKDSNIESDDETSQKMKVDFSEEIERLKQREEQSIQLLIKAVDLLDLISNAAKQANLSETWIHQIEEATNNYLNELKGMGIEEIDVKGKLLDGNYMISIGTVPLESVEGYEKFEVYLVHERGFKNTHTDKIIREAKVINVY